MTETMPPSWARYKARLRLKFAQADFRVCTAFWLFGLVNNVFYVVILTAALDLVGPSIPKATVLLASIIPGLATKSVAPYVVHLAPYSLRVIMFAVLSTCGMLAVALSPDSADAGSISSKVAGIVVANISSGAGEVSFLGLTHFYGPFSLAAWGSGTGAAGLIGAGAYALATTTMGISVRSTLLSSTLLSMVMLVSFFLILPSGPLHEAKRGPHNHRRLDSGDENNDLPRPSEVAGLLSHPDDAPPTSTPRNQHWSRRAMRDLQIKLTRARSLVVPYMLPLFLVYLAEYTINQGVAPTLLFPLDQSPFKHFRAFYPTYGAIYQLGVFISRSSLPFIRIRTLYIPTFLQVLNLFALIAHALWPFIPTIWFVFAIVLWEGLLGGLVYVSTFAAIQEDIPIEEREFSLGAATVSDSAGICIAGFLGAALETSLCNWQVNHGREWCKQL